MYIVRNPQLSLLLRQFEVILQGVVSIPAKDFYLSSQVRQNPKWMEPDVLVLDKRRLQDHGSQLQFGDVVQ